MQQNDGEVRFIIADDHKIFREGLKIMLEKHPQFKVVGEAADGKFAVELAEKTQPHIIIMDISMPNLNGIEASRQILEMNPQITIIALSMHSDSRFVLGALNAGVKAYLLKDSAFEELFSAIKGVRKNQVFLSSAITDLVVKELLARNTQTSSGGAFQVLSQREREILQLLAEGNTTKEIAGLLNISAKTVETHRKQIMDKLNIRSIAGLTKYALREGLTTL